MTATPLELAVGVLICVACLVGLAIAFRRRP